MSTPLAGAEHTLLILPFTPSIYSDPSPLLSIISKTVHASFDFVLIIFSTPHGEQLYTTLRRDPRASFDGFQRFLGRIYAALSEAQWEAGRVLMDVEVRFEGEEGDWADKLGTKDWRILKLEEPQVQALLPQKPLVVLRCPPLPSTSFDPPHLQPGVPVVALGGTFDHLHAAHKLLLHLALFLATRRLIVGIMSDNLLSSKSNAALVDPLDVRIASVEAFLRRCGGGEIMDVLEIHDALGPTAYEADIQALVVSKETHSGGAMVNRVRAEKGLGSLEMFVIDVIAAAQTDLGAEEDEKKLKELKMGSTGIRQWILDHS